MSAPFTVLYGPWQPDLSNNGIPVPFDSGGAATVPVVDTLNVIYANGNYYNAPFPAPITGPASEQVLNAFSWYDSNTQQQLIFAGEGDQIELFSESAGAWGAVPFFTFQSVAVTGFAMQIVLAAIAQGTVHKISVGLGTVTATAVSQAVVTVTPAGGAHAPAAPGAPAVFNLTANVSGGTAITGYNWIINSSTIGASFGSPTSATTTLSVATPGTANITLHVTFSGGTVVSAPNYNFTAIQNPRTLE